MKTAVILCGSGYKDGSEIRESVGVLWALSKVGASSEVFALNESQHDVVNCYTGKIATEEKRNQLVESARIARGKVKPLQELKPTSFDSLIFPGGFGAAKNLCSFAFEGSKGRVHPLVQSTVEAFFGAKKPIGAVCIAPAILALALKGKGLELTLGERGEAALEIEKLSHKHIAKPASGFHIDSKNLIVSTPAYMHEDAPLHEIFLGIEGLVGAVKGLSS